MMDEIKLYKKAGLSNFDILKAGTVNFANYFNDTTTGSIEVGKNADFLFLNENPLENIEVVGQIDGIFFNNKYLNKQELVDLATSVLPNKN
jgi:imidazolonepropionase-like amidohydrolase